MGPDAAKIDWHTSPRVFLIEQGALRALREDSSILVTTEHREGHVWLEALREVAEMYFTGDRRGMVVIEAPDLQF